MQSLVLFAKTYTLCRIAKDKSVIDAQGYRYEKKISAYMHYEMSNIFEQDYIRAKRKDCLSVFPIVFGLS